MGDARRAQSWRRAGTRRKGRRGGEISAGGAVGLVPAASGQVGAGFTVQGLPRLQTGS